MKRLLLLGVVAMLVMGIVGGGVGLLLNRTRSVAAVSTSVATVEVVHTETPQPTLTATASPIETATATATLTPSATPTSTPTLSTLVVQVMAINPDVTLDARPSLRPTTTATELPTLVVPSPAATLAYMPTGFLVPLVGWFRYGVDHPDLKRVGQWEVFTATYRSAERHYLFSDTPSARLTLRFLGAATRVRYARLSSYGVFEVHIDGRTVTTVDAYLPKSAANGDFVTTEAFGLPYGWHTLEILRLDRRNPQSSGGFVAIDGVDIYQNGPEPTANSVSLPATSTFTPSPAPVQKLQVLAAPPTVQPTATPAPPQITTITLTVAYDMNGNKAAEPGEGVRELPVQLVAADTNRVVAEGRTDAQGYLRLEAAGTVPLRLVVPYFNRFWDIASRSTGTRITLLLPPVNRPALIP